MSASKHPEPPVEVLEGMRHPVPMQERPDAEARRRVAIEGIANAIRSGGRSRTRRMRWLAVGAAAAILASVYILYALSGSFAAPHRAETSTPPASAGATVRVLSGTVVTTLQNLSSTVGAGGMVHLSEGDEIATGADGVATLMLPRSVLVKLASSTKARIVNAGESEQHLSLDLGRAEVSVPRPGGPRLFAMKTPDSDVIVHGTEFSVEVEREGGGSAVVTTVSVTRGSVFVAHAGKQRLVETGTTWSSGSEEAPAPAEPVGAVVSETPARDAPRTPARSARRAAPPTPSLADQNRLFQTFLDAREAGDDRAAVRALDELLTRFPETPLADQARLARFRALQRLAGTKPPN